MKFILNRLGFSKKAVKPASEIQEDMKQKMMRDFPLKFLKSHNLQPDHYLLDFGCRQLRRSTPIIEYLNEGRYFGMDVNPQELLKARKRISNENLEYKNISLIDNSKSVDITHLPQFDFVWAMAVFIHLGDEKLLEMLKLIHSVLKPDGLLLANVNIRKERKQFGTWLQFPTWGGPLDFYKEICNSCKLSIVDDLGTMQDVGHILNDRGQHMLKITKIAD